MSTLSTTNLKNPSSGSNNIVLNTDGTTTIAAPSNIIKSGTAVASTSGTAIDFTSIPSWAKRITVMFQGVSTSGTSIPLIQIGDSGGIETTGYVSSGTSAGTSVGTSSSTAGFIIYSATAASISSGHYVLTLFDGNTWVGSGVFKNTTAVTCYGAGDKTLSGTLDRLRITTTNGTDTFDAGSINILYEG